MINYILYQSIYNKDTNIKNDLYLTYRHLTLNCNSLCSTYRTRRASAESLYATYRITINCY